MINKNIFFEVFTWILLLYSIFITGLFATEKKDLNDNINKLNDNLLVNQKINNSLNEQIKIIEEIKNKEFIDKNYFIDNLKLKDYSGTKFKITDEWKKIINNIRSLHKSSSLIWKENAWREVCAWYIWTLSEKIWWKETPYHLWMINTQTRYPAKAWELPSFYAGIWWDIIIDLWDKFSVYKKDYWEKIKINDLKEFFKSAFLEEALFWDIWFLYSETKYSSFLNGWSSNSHIWKNMWYSWFEVVVWEDYENYTGLEIFSKTLKCEDNINKELFNVLENYKLSLNWSRIIFKDREFYFLNSDNSIWDMVKLKYLDKIIYDDITISHYFDARSNVNWLFDMVCSWKFLPINVISINKRLIEKM